MVRTSFRSSDQAHHCSLSEWISQLFLEAERLFLSLLGADTETTASEAKTLQGAVYWVTALNPPMFISFRDSEEEAGQRAGGVARPA